jgi:hypothetical protein
MPTSENFTEEYLDHVVQVLKSLEIENNGMWIHPNEYARLLGLEPTSEFGLHQRLIHLEKRLQQKKKIRITSDVREESPFRWWQNSGRAEKFACGTASTDKTSAKAKWYHFGESLHIGCDQQRELVKDLKKIKFDDLAFKNSGDLWTDDETYRTLILNWMPFLLKTNVPEEFMKRRRTRNDHLEMLEQTHAMLVSIALVSDVINNGTNLFSDEIIVDELDDIEPPAGNTTTPASPITLRKCPRSEYLKEEKRRWKMTGNPNETKWNKDLLKRIHNRFRIIH